ncbi:NDP-sugar synthase [Candidatus Riflebacteria bacterium]
MSDSVKIMIMCGGRGKRLGKLTERIPKPLVEFNGQTILEVKLNRYIDEGFKDIIFCIGYKGELIKRNVEKFAKNLNIKFSDAGEEAGILKRFWMAKDHFDEMVLMTYGDTYSDLNLNNLLETHNKGNNEATIVAAPIRNPFGLVEFDNDNKVTYFKEKPVLNYYIGLAIINKSALDLIPPKIIELPDGKGLVSFFKILIALEKLGVYYHSGLEITFNTQRELKLAEKKWRNFFTAAEDNIEE